MCLSMAMCARNDFLSGGGASYMFSCGHSPQSSRGHANF